MTWNLPKCHCHKHYKIISQGYLNLAVYGFFSSYLFERLHTGDSCGWRLYVVWVHLSFCHINVNTMSQKQLGTFFKFGTNIHLDPRIDWLDIEWSTFTMTSCLPHSHQCNIYLYHICMYSKLQLDELGEALSIFCCLESFLFVQKQMILIITHCVELWVLFIDKYQCSCSYRQLLDIYALFCTGFDKWGPLVHSS